MCVSPTHRHSLLFIQYSPPTLEPVSAVPLPLVLFLLLPSPGSTTPSYFCASSTASCFSFSPSSLVYCFKLYLGLLLPVPPHLPYQYSPRYLISLIYYYMYNLIILSFLGLFSLSKSGITIISLNQSQPPSSTHCSYSSDSGTSIPSMTSCSSPSSSSSSINGLKLLVSESKPT